MRSALVTILAFVVVACSGGGSGGELANSTAPTQMIASPGGLWIGVDSEANPVTLLANEAGFFFILRGPLLESGGILTATSSTRVQGVLLIPKESENSESVTGSDCKLTGLIDERASLTLDVQCRDSQVSGILTTLSLTYDTRYDRDSSLATVAGNFFFGRNASVLNIAEDGTVFSQDGANCLTNGRISVTNSSYNVYGMYMEFINCPGLDSGLNGDSFSGLALLDETETPERLIFVVSSDRPDRNTTLFSWADRL